MPAEEKPFTPTDIRSLLAVVRSGKQDPAVSIALFAQHVAKREQDAWSRRAHWQSRATPAAASEASVALGRTDAFCEVLGDQQALAQDLQMMGFEGL